MNNLHIDRLELDLRGIDPATAQAAARALVPALAQALARARLGALVSAPQLDAGRLQSSATPPHQQLAAQMAHRITGRLVGGTPT
jgi:hypothetical protein